MSEAVQSPCTVKAFKGEVLLECGVAATTLTPHVARDAGKRLLAEADRAERDRRKTED